MTKDSFRSLINISAKLRSKKGCPWDRKQTFETMAKCISKESNEVVSAINKKDNNNLKEEIGDLLFLIIMIAQIAKEKKLFDIEKVMKGIEKKIISRHTWVFGKDKVKTAEDAVKIWKENKKKERK